jgi:hypothetical protein
MNKKKTRTNQQIYFHWYEILGLLYKRALFDLQFVHNLFWLKQSETPEQNSFIDIIYHALMKLSKIFYLNSQRNTNFSGSFQPDQEKACNICPFQRFQYFPKA